MIKVQEGITKLNENEAAEPYNILAKSFFNFKRARPDIQLAISFLSTGLKEPDKDDYSNIIHLEQYLKSMQDIQLKLRSNNTNIIKCYISESHGVHNDMRRHIGVTLQIGKVCIINRSIKQILNKKAL